MFDVDMSFNHNNSVETKAIALLDIQWGNDAVLK